MKNIDIVNQDVGFDVPDLLTLDNDETLILLSELKEEKLIEGCLMRGLPCVSLETKTNLNSRDCIILICKRQVDLHSVNMKSASLSALSSISRQRLLFIRVGENSNSSWEGLHQILGFWIRVLCSLKHGWCKNAVFLGNRRGHFFCTTFFCTPFRDPQEKTSLGRMRATFKGILVWAFFICSIRAALVAI